MVRLERKSIHRAVLFCFVVCIPLSWASFLIGSVYRTLTIALLAVFLYAVGGVIKIPNENTKVWSAWTVLMSYIAISTVWAENFSGTMMTNIGMILIFVIAVMFAAYRTEENSAAWLDRAWIIAGAFCAGLFLLGGSGSIGDRSSRETLVILGTETDPNEFGGALLIPASLGLVYFFREKRMPKKILHLVLILAEIYVILLTGSRGALLSVVVAIAITALVIFKPTPKSVLTMILLIVVLAIVLSNVILPMIPKDIVDRLSWDSIAEDQGTNRIKIWKSAINQLIEGPIARLVFGYGDASNSFLEIYGSNVAMHNQFLQMVVNYGLVGLGLYLRLLWQSLQAIAKNNRRYLGAFVGMMILSATITMLSYYKPLWILLLSAYVCQNETEEVRETQEIRADKRQRIFAGKADC